MNRVTDVRSTGPTHWEGGGAPWNSAPDPDFPDGVSAPCGANARATSNSISSEGDDVAEELTKSAVGVGSAPPLLRPSGEWAWLKSETRFGLPQITITKSRTSAGKSRKKHVRYTAYRWRKAGR